MLTLLPLRPSTVGWNFSVWTRWSLLQIYLKYLFGKRSQKWFTNALLRDHLQLLIHELSSWCPAVLWDRPWFPSTKAWTLRILRHVAHYFVLYFVLCFGTKSSWRLTFFSPVMRSSYTKILLEISVCLLGLHNILEPTTGVTFFNSGSKSDPIELFPSIVQVIAC
jgi:hypothetical protein